MSKYRKTGDDIAKEYGISRQYLYYLAKKLGKMPTKEDVINASKTKQFAELSSQTGYSAKYIRQIYYKNGRMPTKEELLAKKNKNKEVEKT